MTGLLRVDFDFTVHIQEDEPHLCFDLDLGRDGLGVARHLKVVLLAADDGARFVVAAGFVGFEVYDSQSLSTR